MEKLYLESTIKEDIARYKRMLEMYRSRNADAGDEVRENTKETERHIENVIRELEALLRDRRQEH